MLGEPVRAIHSSKMVSIAETGAPLWTQNLRNVVRKKIGD
jgi:hypothetical protein